MIPAPVCDRSKNNGGGGCSLQAAPYASITCMYSTTGSYSCGKNEDANPQCDSFYRVGGGGSAGGGCQKNKPDNRFNDLMGKN